MCLWKGTGNAICHGLCVCVCACVCVHVCVCVCWLPEQQSLFQPLISSRNNHLIRRAQTHARADTHTHTHTLIQMTRLWAPLHSTYVCRRDANTHADTCSTFICFAGTYIHFPDFTGTRVATFYIVQTPEPKTSWSKDASREAKSLTCVI